MASIYDSPPGTIYDGFQCRMMYGDKAKVCHWNLEKICERLMCQIGDKCRSNGASTADGCSWGKNKWKEFTRIEKRANAAVGWTDCSERTLFGRACGEEIQYARGWLHHEVSGDDSIKIGVGKLNKLLRYSSSYQVSKLLSSLAGGTNNCIEIRTIETFSRVNIKTIN